MNRRTEVVVVGAGIIGAAIAHELIRHGVMDVVVVDKAAGPAEGSTGSSAAFIRCRYTRDEVVKLAYDSQHRFQCWSSYVGTSDPRAVLHQHGVLWILGSTKDATEIEAARLRRQGVAADVLDAAALNERFPALSPCDEALSPTNAEMHKCNVGDAFLLEAGGGFIDPVGATQDLIEAVRRGGATVQFNAPVTAVRRSGDKVVGITLADGDHIDADLVVNAAGPWCNVLNTMAGVSIAWPLKPTRIQMVYRGWPTDLGPIPITIDLAVGNAFRLEASGSQVLMVSTKASDEREIVDDPDDFKRSADHSFRDTSLAALHHRVPDLEARGTPSSIAGLYTINRTDHHPIVGPTDVPGFWLANGFSGHGLKLAPGIGSMVAQGYTGSCLDGDTSIPMAYFGLDREPLVSGDVGVLA